MVSPINIEAERESAKRGARKTALAFAGDDLRRIQACQAEAISQLPGPGPIAMLLALQTQIICDQSALIAELVEAAESMAVWIGLYPCSSATQRDLLQECFDGLNQALAKAKEAQA